MTIKPPTTTRAVYRATWATYSWKSRPYDDVATAKANATAQYVRTLYEPGHGAIGLRWHHCGEHWHLYDHTDTGMQVHPEHTPEPADPDEPDTDSGTELADVYASLLELPEEVFHLLPEPLQTAALATREPPPPRDQVSSLRVELTAAYTALFRLSYTAWLSLDPDIRKATCAWLTSPNARDPQDGP